MEPRLPSEVHRGTPPPHPHDRHCSAASDSQPSDLPLQTCSFLWVQCPEEVRATSDMTKCYSLIQGPFSREEVCTPRDMSRRKPDSVWLPDRPHWGPLHGNPASRQQVLAEGREPWRGKCDFRHRSWTECSVRKGKDGREGGALGRAGDPREPPTRPQSSTACSISLQASSSLSDAGGKTWREEKNTK